MASKQSQDISGNAAEQPDLINVLIETVYEDVKSIIKPKYHVAKWIPIPDPDTSQPLDLLPPVIPCLTIAPKHDRRYVRIDFDLKDIFFVVI